MDSPTQPTFLPHEAVVSGGGSRRESGGLAELLLLAAILIFVVSAALAVGVFLYTQYLQSANASEESQLSSAESSFDPSLIQQLTRLDSRMTAADQLLQAHLAPSEIFTMLQQSTVQDISFNTLTLDATNPQQITLTMQGVAGSVNSIALQAQVFSQSGIIQSPIFSNIDAEQDGVHFNFTALVNPSAITYEGLVTGASTSPTSGTQTSTTQTPTTTQAPVQPASPFTGTSTAATTTTNQTQ
jgi:hypothetical protein